MISPVAIDVVEWVGKFAGSAAVVWGFLVAAVRPFIAWRQTAKLAAVMRLEATFRQIVRDELRVIYDEHDDLLEVAIDNRERQNETNDLLNAIGLRSGTMPECEEITDMIRSLDERRKARRRHLSKP